MNIAKSVSQLQEWAQANRHLATDVLTARAFAESENERVNAYILPIFNSYGFTNDRGGRTLGEKITDPEQVYLSLEEERVVEYFAECDAAHRAHGFEGPDGFCPAAVADHSVGRAEHLLLIAVGEFAGFDGQEVSKPSLRTEVLNWGLGVCSVEAR